MKRFLLSLLFVSSVSAHAGKIQNVPKDQIDHFEGTHSLNTVCAVHFKMKESEEVLVGDGEVETLEEKMQINVSPETLKKSNYALLMADCGLNPLGMMFEAQDLEFISGRETRVAGWMQFQVVFKDGTKLPLPIHSISFKAASMIDAQGNPSAVIENKSALQLDGVWFVP